MVRFELEIPLDKTDSLANKLRDMKPLLQKIALYFEAETRMALERGQGRVTQWPDLAEKTKKQKMKKKGSPYPILTFTGRLRNSINSEVSQTQAMVFSGVAYGVFHQLGTSRMPARPFLEIADKDVDFILAELAKYLGGE